MANNESTNLRVSCDTGFADLPPGDFLPPRDPFNQQDVFGAQIFKIAVSRDAHAPAGVDAKLHLNDPQVEGIFGEPANNSVCRLPHVGGVSTAASQNVTACIRTAGSGSRETFRNTFMADTAGSKTQSEDASGAQNGTTTSCLQTKEAGGTQISTKRVKLGAGNARRDQLPRARSPARSATSTRIASTRASTARWSRASIRTRRCWRRRRTR